jgi:hypothetical protein
MKIKISEMKIHTKEEVENLFNALFGEFQTKGRTEFIAFFTDEYSNGWQDWHGGESPVPLTTKIDYELRDGYKSTGSARGLIWSHTLGYADIIKWRIHKSDEENKWEIVK